MAPSFTPRTPKTPNPARLLELTVDDSDEIELDDILELSIVPEEAHEVFRSTVEMVNAFFSCTETSISLLVNEKAAAHEPLAKSPFKQDVLHNNLLTLMEYKRAGGNMWAGPSALEQCAFIDAASSPPARSIHQTPQAAAAPQMVVTRLRLIRKWRMVRNLV
jgi:hypothetical protein